MTKYRIPRGELSRYQVWVRESPSWPARRFRQWAQSHDLEWWKDVVELSIATCAVGVVFAAIVLAEQFPLP